MRNLWKFMRMNWFKGKRSRNKASVGEPADGSLHIVLIHSFTRISLFVICVNVVSVFHVYQWLEDLLVCKVATVECAFEYDILERAYYRVIG